MQVDENVQINGNLYARTMTIPAGAVTDAGIQALAGIKSSKLQHKHRPTYAQANGADSVAERKVIHVVRGTTATINDLKAGPITAAAGGTKAVTVDLKKNGTTILSGVITIDSSKAAFTQTSPSGFTSTACVQGDVLEIVTAVSGAGGTQVQGIFATLDIDEDAQ